MNLFLKKIAIIFILIVTCPAFANIQVPKGFEEFARGEDDMLLVSIYGKELGLFRIHVDLEHVTFLEPNKLAEAVKNKFNSSEKLQQIINERLKKSLDRNTQLACSNNAQDNCDFIKTDSVAVIYDENNAAILLFLPPEFTPTNEKKKLYFDATKNTNNALIHQQSINYTADQDSKNITLQGNSTLGITDSSYFNMNWNWNGQDNKSGFKQKGYLNNLFLRKDFLKKYYLQAGVMDSSDIYTNAGGAISFSQLPLDRIKGVRIGSTLAWTDTASQLIGTPLNVILTRDSRVDIYRGQQLLKSVYMSAGSRQIDDNSLPAGSYLVTLKIYEDNRLVRTEQTPYTRLSSSMSNNIQWFLQAGTKNDNNYSENTINKDSKQLAAGGFRIPLPFSSTLTVGGSCDAGVFYNETALEWTHGFNSGPIDGILYLRSGIFNGSNGNKGKNQQISYNDGFSLSYNRTTLDEHVSAENQGKTSTEQSSGTDIAFSIPVRSWSLSLTYRKIKNSASAYFNIPSSNMFSSNISTTSVANVSSSRSLQLTLSRSFNALGLLFNTSLSGFKTERNNSSRADIGGYLNMNISAFSDNNSSLFSLGARYDTQRDGKDSLNYNASYSKSDGLNNTTFSANGVNSDSAYLSASRTLNSSVGDGSIYLTDSYDVKNNQHRFSSSGTYNFSVAADRQGIYFGKWISGQAAAGVVVDMSNNDETAKVNAIIGSSGDLEVQGSSKRMVAVSAYQSSKLEFHESNNIQNGISAEIKRGGRDKTVFMAPGQLQKNVINMETHYTWIGTMYNDNKKPLGDAQPLNVASWTALLGRGAYLIESTNAIKKLYFSGQDSFWECSLTVQRIKDVVRWLGNTTCRRVTYAALPAEEAKQAKIQMVSQSSTATAEGLG